MSRRTLVPLIVSALVVLGSPAAFAQTLSIKTDLATLQAAADKGQSSAMSLIALKYHTGRDVPRDYTQAAAWYRRASDSGHGTSMFYLGTFYWSGRGVAKDLVEAYKWLDLSARFRPTQDARVQSAQACESLARVMSAAQLLEAKQREAAWQTAFIPKK